MAFLQVFFHVTLLHVSLFNRTGSNHRLKICVVWITCSLRYRPDNQIAMEGWLSQNIAIWLSSSAIVALDGQGPYYLLESRAVTRNGRRGSRRSSKFYVANRISFN